MEIIGVIHATMINAKYIYWIVAVIAVIALVVLFGRDINNKFIQIDTAHCEALQEASWKYPHANYDEIFEMDGCEEVLNTSENPQIITVSATTTRIKKDFSIQCNLSMFGKCLSLKVENLSDWHY